MQKILSLSEHEVSEPQNSNSKFLYGLDFLLNKFMAKRHPKSTSIYPKMVTARPIKFILFCIWKQRVSLFASEFPLHLLVKEPWH